MYPIIVAAVIMTGQKAEIVISYCAADEDFVKTFKSKSYLVGAHVAIFFFFPGLSRHLGSPVKLIMVFLHAALFVVLSSFRTTSAMSLLHASFHLRFGRPLLLFPGVSTSSILLTVCSSFILLKWPYHVSRFSVIFLETCAV